MTASLIRLIQRAYPSGTIYDRDDDALVNEMRDMRMSEALNIAANKCDIVWAADLFDKPAYRITITQKNHPSFDKWISEMENTDKIAWIRKNGSPYPVLWLKISRVADYYYYHYNHWSPRGDTGYLDADYKMKPADNWLNYERVINEQLKHAGFIYFEDSLASERTDMVLERDYDSIPEDDPRWDDEDFEPPFIPSTVHECLFSY